MNNSKYQEAIDFLSNKLTDDAEGDSFVKYVRTLQNKGGDSWFAQDRFHFSTGMAIRNLLRDHGFGESDLGVSNLDDYYLDILEKAMVKYEAGTNN